MLQGGELLIILLLALVLFGPQRFPDFARRMGRWVAGLRDATKEITQDLESEIAETREAARGLAKEVMEPFDDVRTEIDETFESGASRRYEWSGPKPESGPTAEDALEDLDRIEGRRTDPTGTEHFADPVEPKDPEEPEGGITEPETPHDPQEPEEEP